jgi:hypothetical protein
MEQVVEIAFRKRRWASSPEHLGIVAATRVARKMAETAQVEPKAPSLLLT